MKQSVMVRNILRVYNNATENQWVVGSNWYLDAHLWCKDQAKEYGFSLEQVADIVAIMSPRNNWNLNLRLARNMLDHGDASTLYAAVRKARMILNGSDLDNVLASKAKKVRSFAACIKDPFNTDFVTVDRHALDVAMATIGNDDTRRILERSGVYDAVSDAYKAASDKAGLLPLETQAICWVSWRELKGVK